jgi:hypothetical protein
VISIIKKFQYRLNVFIARLGLKLAASASKKLKTRTDRFCAALIEKALQPKSPAEDYMRDDIADAEISFSADELARYQSGQSIND